MVIKVLVVDDNALVALATVDMLEDLGYGTCEASSAAEALSMLEAQGDIEVMMTDLQMPGITGAQLAISAQEIHPELPVIIASGNIEVAHGTYKGWPALAKPYTRQQLDELIKKIVGQARAVARG